MSNEILPAGDNGERYISYETLAALEGYGLSPERALNDAIKEAVKTNPGLQVNIQDDWLKRGWIVRWRTKETSSVAREARA